MEEEDECSGILPAQKREEREEKEEREERKLRAGVGGTMDRVKWWVTEF